MFILTTYHPKTEKATCSVHKHYEGAIEEMELGQLEGYMCFMEDTEEWEETEIYRESE